MFDRVIWIMVFIIAISSEGIALFFQYVLDALPCKACVQVRIWMLAYIVIAIIGVLTSGRKTGMRFIAHILAMIPMLGIVERSWYLFRVENNTIISSCKWDIGYFSWTHLDELFPSIFAVQWGCTATPVLILGITMAECLLIMGLALTLLHICRLISLLGPGGFREYWIAKHRF